MTQILVVDDEVAIREILTEFLSNHGYSVEGAETGAQALAKARSMRPQVILLDILMPGMNGIEALKRLRQESPGSAVIMISGHADTDLALQALDLGAYDFIQKPLDLKYLERTLLAKIVTLDPSGGPEPAQEVEGARGSGPGRRDR
jgi:DNA-binding NtrC family response regulator